MQQLFTEFPPISKAEWLAKIEQDLKGKPLADLQFRLGQIQADPFPHADDWKETPPALPGNADWEIGEDIPADDILKANKTALTALDGGVQALRFLLEDNPGLHRMESLLEGIVLEAVSIHFFQKNKNAQPLHLLRHFSELAAKQGVEQEALRGSVNWDFSDAVVADDAAELIDFSQKKLPGFRTLPVNGDRFFEGDDSALAELVKTLAHAVQWIKTLEEKGIPPETVNSQLYFTLATGKNYFVEIAKIRALKHLWANILSAYNLSNADMPPIASRLAPASQTDDPHSNMIQAATQAMSAIIGGADRLTVIPSDAFQGEPTAFSRRIARNVQHLLKMESRLDWVKDPAAGSYFIEDLTLQLAAAAWRKFQQL